MADRTASGAEVLPMPKTSSIEIRQMKIKRSQFELSIMQEELEMERRLIANEEARIRLEATRASLAELIEHIKDKELAANG